ncbi:hypothetical protein ACOI1C_06485 [Bacillus sp. DJP31]
MTRKVPYHLVDLFAENKYEGNQLAVFLDSSSLTVSEMLQIAKEVN